MKLDAIVAAARGSSVASLTLAAGLSAALSGTAAAEASPYVHALRNLFRGRDFIGRGTR
jgi:hypothetical protein